MRRENNLYPKIAEPENLRLAFWKAQRGKRHRPDVQAFRADLDLNLDRLRSTLLDESLSLGVYHYFTVRDPKVRQICAASFHDRVLHHAVMNVCEPVFERYAITDTYACRPGKGTHRAVARAQEFARRFPFLLRMDISRYFDNIDHRVLMRLLARRFKDRQLLRLFDRILETYQTRCGKGLPIGNLTSQHFANYYLGALDHHVKEVLQVRGYLRYMDDFMLFGKTRHEMRRRLADIREFLSNELSLELKDGVQLKATHSGVSFLGFRVFPFRTGLTSRSRRRFVTKLRLYEEEFLSGKLSENDLSRRMQAAVGFTEWADAAGFRRRVIAEYGVRF